MAREDILALGDDDLAALSTRGKVKEARKELDDGRASGTVSEEAGALRASWNDGVTTELPAGEPLRKGRCSCGSVTLCKHLVRLALVYRRQAGAPAAPAGPWDPGSIGDAELAAQLGGLALTRARQLDAAGTLAEVVRGSRPVARFHVPGCTVRFLVPGDARYARCDCARATGCEHVLLAVWAFRRLPPDRRAGVVTGGAPAPVIDGELLDLADSTATEFVEQGVSGGGPGWTDRLARLRDRCEAAALVWPAEVVDDLLRQQQSYASHDARFDPRRVAELLGEFVLRLDAIRANGDGLPQRLVRGGADRAVEVEKGLFWGLGCGVEAVRGGVAVSAYLHDCKAGTVAVLSREVADTEDPAGLPSFARLGGRAAVKGATFAALGGGVLQLENGRRTTRHELRPGRGGASVTVQDRLAWEEIGPPVGVEEFADLEERLAGLPPAALRPRRLAEDVHVLHVAAVEAARFDPVTHSVQAVLHDRAGQAVLLDHPFTSRGRAGAEALLRRLAAPEVGLRFVSGRVRRTGAGLTVAPLGLVWQVGEKRDLLQPWVEGTTGEAADAGSEGAPAAHSADPVGGYLADVQEAVGELVVLGVARADVAVARQWRELARRGEAIGFGALAARVGALAEAIDRRTHVLRYDPAPAAQLALELAALVRLAAEVG